MRFHLLSAKSREPEDRVSREAARAAGAPPPVAPDGRGCSALGYVHVFHPSALGKSGQTLIGIETKLQAHMQSVYLRPNVNVRR